MNVTSINRILFHSSINLVERGAIDVTRTRILVSVPGEAGGPTVNAVATMKLTQKVMSVFDNANYTFRVQEAGVGSWEFSDVKPREPIRQAGGMRLGEMTTFAAEDGTGKSRL